MQDKSKFTKIATGILLFFVVAGLVYVLFYWLAFFVTKTVPSNNSTLNSDSNEITIYFNKNISETKDSLKNKIILQPGVKYSDIKVKDNYLRLYGTEFESHKSYALTLLNIKAESGQVINQKTIKFKTGDLPLIEKDESKYPLQFDLPYSNSHFQIDATKIGDQVTYKISVLAILNRPSQEQEYRQQLHQYSQEALDWLKAKGVDTTKYKVEFDPPNAPSY